MGIYNPLFTSITCHCIPLTYTESEVVAFYSYSSLFLHIHSGRLLLSDYFNYTAYRVAVDSLNQT